MRLGNGRWETAKFNERLQVTELGLGNSSGDASAWKVNYEFGELNTDGTVNTAKNTGNIAKQTISFNGLSQPFVQSYKYDSLYRLTEANEKANTTENWKQNFTYDRYGNRQTHDKFINNNLVANNSQTHPTIDPNTNRITSNGYAYDKVGNLIVDGEGRTFTFDGNNKQTFVSDGSNATVGEYFYDGSGMRVKKKRYVNGVHEETVIFAYSGGKLVEEFSTKTPPTEKKTKYLTEDHLGTPRVITDELGQVITRRDFMPFGEDLYNGVGSRDSALKYNSADDDVRQKFTGYKKDEETQLDFAEARMYENRHARFTAVDPLLASGKSDDPQSFNRYVYVMNKPFIHVDRDGKYPTEIHNSLIDKAFSKLTDVQREFIKWGSALVDTAKGTGNMGLYSINKNGSIPRGSKITGLSGFIANPAIDFPVTMIPSNAFKHSMTPPGKTKAEAVSTANDFVERNMNTVIKKQESWDVSGNDISLNALTYFGMAQHTVMDSMSPAHRYFQEFKYNSTSNTSSLFGFAGINLVRDIASALNHKDIESTITPWDEADTILMMRVAMLTGLGENIFNQAVPESERQSVYDYINRAGFRYNEGGPVPTSWSVGNRGETEGFGVQLPLNEPQRDAIRFRFSTIPDRQN